MIFKKNNKIDNPSILNIQQLLLLEQWEEQIDLSRGNEIR